MILTYQQNEYWIGPSNQIVLVVDIFLDLFLKDLQERLENNKYVKATDINITCYNTKPGKLDSVKDLLHL